MGDDAPKSAIRPEDLALLVRLARGRREVVELGTAKAWTAISLALADRERRVTSFDPVVQHARERYLSLVSPSVRRRIRLVDQPGESAPADDRPVEFLLIDSSHEREATVREYRAWQPRLAPGALVVFDDYGHPEFPGVRAAIEALGLEGDATGFLFIHRRKQRGSL